jgi:hypothetical protein
MRDAAPGTIDLAWAGTDADGTRVYAPPWQAVGGHLGHGLVWLCEHPNESLRGLALGSILMGCLYISPRQL